MTLGKIQSASRQVFSVFLVAGAVGLLEALQRLGINVPNPQLFTALAITYAAYLGGYVGGIAGAVVGIGYGLYFFSSPGEFLTFTPANQARVMVNFVTLPAIAFLVSHLSSRLSRSAKAHAIRFMGSAGVSHFQVDPHDRIIGWSAPLQQLTGWSFDEISGSTITSLFSNPADRDKWQEIKSAATAGDSLQIELSLRRKMGGTIPILVSAATDSDENGNLSRFIVVAQDISQQKAVEKDLQSNESRFRDFAKAGNDTLWETGAGHRLTFRISREGGRNKLSPGFFIGKAWWEVHNAPECVESFSALRNLMEQRKPFRNCLVRLSDIQGKRRYRRMSANSMFDERGTFIGFRGTSSDVTEEILAQDRNLILQKQLEDILEYSPSAIVLKDKNLRYMMVNRRFREWMGLEEAEILGLDRTGIIALQRAKNVDADFLEMDEEVLTKGTQVERELTLETAAGETRNVLVLKFPVYSPSGEVTAVGGFVTDISELRAAQERLNQSQKMESIGQLTGGVAHDFNNLLAIIQGNAELLGMEIGENNEFLSTILGASGRGAELTGRLLAFSRRQTLRPLDVDLAGLIDRLAPILRRTLGETIEVTTSRTPDLWHTRADPGQLENVVLNLAINARDAMPSGGNLRISCSNIVLDTSNFAEASGLEPGDYVLLSIADTGHGMTPQVKARAFEPFFTTKEVGKGSGLGLSMVHGFAIQSGGHVAIYSEVGLGTSIQIYLPRSAGSENIAGFSESADEAVAGATGHEHILLVEDDEDVRNLVTRILHSLGYRVTQTDRCAKAISALESGEKFDLILSDVVLPGGISGPELARQIRMKHPDARFVFMSGYPAVAAEQHGLIDDEVLLDKPFTKKRLATVLRQALDG